MASSSDESSKAPDNFQVSTTSNDDDNCCDGGINTRQRGFINAQIQNTDYHKSTLRCPLCRKQQRAFLCCACVRNGNFSHSKTQHGQTLTEKQQAFLNFKSDLSTFSNRYNQHIEAEKSIENVRFEISKKKEQLRLLQQLIAEKRAKLQNLSEVRDELHKANAEKRKHLPKYPKKVKELEDYVLDRIEKIDKLREQHHNLLEKLQKNTRRNIEELVTYIFPISEVVLKDDQQKQQTHKTSEDAETVAALADAKNTSYIRGKWVIHGSGISEVQYRIVAPSLPANGDYSAYLDWLTDNKDDVPKPSTTNTEITPSRVTAYRIIGALTYTTQLLQLLSYYLDVRLPFKLTYR